MKLQVFIFIFILNSTSFEGLKLLRKIIDASHSLAGTHSGVLDEFLAINQKEQLNRLSTEIRLIRKGFDVTDYLNEVFLFSQSYINYGKNKKNFNLFRKKQVT